MTETLVRKAMSNARRRILCAVLTLIAACSSSTDAIPLSALNGAWLSNTQEVPGLSSLFTLTLTDAHITGAGQWAVLGGQSGTVTVTGLTSGNAIIVDLTLGHDSPGTLPFLIEHFEGRLESPRKLVGTLTFAGGATEQIYSKVGP